MRPKDGGAAFPTLEIQTVQGQDIVVRQTGMTLLDWFAGKAMQGLCSKKRIQDDFGKFDLDSVTKQIAFDSYAMAEAMLAEKQKREARNG